MINFESKPIRKILTYLVYNPNEKLHLRDLSTKVKIDPGNLSRILNHLSKSDLLVQTEIGRLKFFSLNRKHPLFEDIQSIIRKIEGPEITLTEKLSKIPDINKVILHGSFASGHMDSLSDIDLLVIGTCKSLDLSAAISPLEKKFGRSIHFRIMSENEFAKRKKMKDPFVETVLKGKTKTILNRDESSKALQTT